MAESLLDAESLGHFRSARRRVQDTYDLGTAQNNYQRQVAGSQYGRSLGDLTRQFDQIRTKMPWGAARRGMLNSGLYQRQLGEYGADRVRAFSNLRGVYDDQLGGLNLADSQLSSVRTGALNDIEEQQRNRIASVAAMLRGAR